MTTQQNLADVLGRVLIAAIFLVAHGAGDWSLDARRRRKA
jgi:uncharacterized membrane protein YphA (DoxX/SURF4 family)